MLEDRNKQIQSSIIIEKKIHEEISFAEKINDINKRERYIKKTLKIYFSSAKTI